MFEYRSGTTCNKLSADTQTLVKYPLPDCKNSVLGTFVLGGIASDIGEAYQNSFIPMAVSLY